MMTSPAHQRNLHQKKRRRRSSGIPPMDFNNPDDVYSSSPLSGESAVGSSPFTDSADQEGSDDGDSTAMSLVTDASEVTTTGRISGPSDNSNDSTGSSARLDAALKQAAESAGTQVIEADESGDVSMEIAEDSVTDAFHPWMDARQAQLRAGGSPMKHGAKIAPVLEKSKENVNPFSPAFKAGFNVQSSTYAKGREESNDDLSMDITQAVGGILPRRKQAQDDRSDRDGAAMDITVAVGRMQSNDSAQDTERSFGPKRRRTLSSGSPVKISKESQMSPRSKRASHSTNTNRRRSSGLESNLGAETMDFTTAFGGIQPSSVRPTGIRRTSAASRRSSADISTADDDEPMDLTMAIGHIQNSSRTVPDEDPTLNSNEELSMELTTVIGGIHATKKVAQEGLMTPTTEAPPEASAVASTPKDQTRFIEVEELTPKRLTPILEKQGNVLGMNTPPKRPRKSPRSSARHSTILTIDSSVVMQPTADEPATPATPQLQIGQASEDEKENDPPTPSPKKPSIASATKRASETPEKQSSVKKTKALSESMRLLSTPRKEVSHSPLKRLANVSPKKAITPKAQSPTKKTLTPLKRPTPTKKTLSITQFQADKSLASPATQDRKTVEKLIKNEGLPASEASSPERIQLQDFLNMTSIRFMELTTTKRRHTAAPSAIKGIGLHQIPSDAQQSLQSRVVAGACVVPTLEMFQHACRELKRYIASGRDVVDQIAAEVSGSQPMLFGEYANAPRAQKAIMDKQFVNVKTNARLSSKAMWYEWRSQLLKGLKQGLEGIADGLDEDAKRLAQREQIMDEVLPALQVKKEEMLAEKQILEEQAREFNGYDEKELDQARAELIDIEAQVEEKKKILEHFQQDMHERQEAIDMAQERKIEMMAEIQEAERVREECRGWSAAEVRDLEGTKLGSTVNVVVADCGTESVEALEARYGWSITSASGTNVTMVYRNDIQLCFDLASFQLGDSSSATKRENSPIRLTYIGDAYEHRSKPLATEKRFFLQMMRAHLQCVVQGQTRVKELLKFVTDGWEKACTVSNAFKSLETEFITEASIVSDENMMIQSMMLLSELETKVTVGFEIGAAICGGRLDAHVTPIAKVVYGERYNEAKMSEFLTTTVGNRLHGWSDAVNELRKRLTAKGRKGKSRGTP